MTRIENSFMPDPGNLPEQVWLWTAKLSGAVLGSAISLAYMLPHGKREAAIRFVVGLLAGISFGSVAGAKIVQHLGLAGALSRLEITLMGASAASLCAWWGLGLLHRLMTRKSDEAIAAHNIQTNGLKSKETP